VDPELQRMLLRVSIVGGFVVAVATVALVLAFRGFEKKTRRSLVIIAFAVAFILTACAAFLRWSFVK
jgi:multisubunit Na+/H+ antiporter MnhB subunit